MDTEHLNDLRILQDKYADVLTTFEWYFIGIQKSMDKLRKLNADISQKIRESDVPIPRN